ncbi:glycosyltransferase [Prosthecobacter fluviatilis]|uniref:Glycosyltransferase n=1 Tax=Prosthecobacter fluviatilis TaxID=445931 RepID=A0ABW0KJ43_9BACT
MNFLKRLQMLALLRLKDNIRYSRTLRHLNALRLYAQSRISSDKRAAVHACRALGFSELSSLDQRLSHSLRPWIDLPPEDGFWENVIRASHPRYDAPLRREPGLTRSVLLKSPAGSGEKGVLLMLFEYNWARLVLGLTPEEFAWLDEHYDLVLSTSWSPTDYAALGLILSRTSGPVFVQACNFQEVPKIAGLHPRVRLLESLGCDWINPDLYPPSSEQRTIDFLMIANWGEFKRHWDFFRALSRMPANLRVVLVGQAEGGRDAEFIRRQARLFGVPQALEVYQSLPIDEVARLQSQARVALIFSRREGCCVAFVEAMFAGCAVGIRADAHVGPLAYVNQSTGLRLRPGHLPEDLMRLHEIAATAQPAAWAQEHISCYQSHMKLNRLMKQSSLERGLPWTQDIALPHWRPYPAHARREEAAALMPAYRDLHERFPRVFGNEFFDQVNRIL